MIEIVARPVSCPCNRCKGQYTVLVDGVVTFRHQMKLDLDKQAADKYADELAQLANRLISEGIERDALLRILRYGN